MSETLSSVSARTLAAEHLCFGYHDVTVIDDVSFQFRLPAMNASERSADGGRGEFVAIVGPNGCGKSTLLKLLMAALSPRAGNVLFDGRPIRSLDRIAIARRIALVPQMGGGDAAAHGTQGFTVLQTVLMARYATHIAQAPGLLRAAGGLGILGFESPGDVTLAQQAMWHTDVHHLAQRPLETLSGGERQRVAIARAFAQETPILLLDEPTSALDLFHQLELLEQLRGRVSQGKLVAMVTHDLNLAAQCATRVLVMDAGRLVADGPPESTLTASVLEPVYHVQVQRSAAGLLTFQRRQSGQTDP